MSVAGPVVFVQRLTGHPLSRDEPVAAGTSKSRKKDTPEPPAEDDAETPEAV